MTSPLQPEHLPTGEKILLSEWAGTESGPRLVGATYDRNPCPICGHPTGDCTSDVHSGGQPT